MELTDEVEEIFNIEGITPQHLQDETVGPLIVKFYKKLKTEKASTDAYLILLTNYAR